MEEEEGVVYSCAAGVANGQDKRPFFVLTSNQSFPDTNTALFHPIILYLLRCSTQSSYDSQEETTYAQVSGCVVVVVELGARLEEEEEDDCFFLNFFFFRFTSSTVLTLQTFESFIKNFTKNGRRAEYGAPVPTPDMMSTLSIEVDARGTPMNCLFLVKCLE